MRQFLEQNQNYIDKYAHQRWDFCVFQLIDNSAQRTSESINLADWIEHPFTYNNGSHLVYGYLPADEAKEACDVLNDIFAEHGIYVLLERNVSVEDLMNRLYHPDEFWLSLIQFDLEELQYVQQEVGSLLAVANQVPGLKEEIDSLLEIVSKKGLHGLSELQRMRLDQLSAKL